jgi:hypothetical protein
MNPKLIGAAIVALPLAVGGIVVANVDGKAMEQADAQEVFICPVTGEELPCPGCCVLNQEDR